MLQGLYDLVPWFKISKSIRKIDFLNPYYPPLLTQLKKFECSLSSVSLFYFPHFLISTKYFYLQKIKLYARIAFSKFVVWLSTKMFSYNLNHQHFRIQKVLYMMSLFNFNIQVFLIFNGRSNNTVST